jgi:putative hemolysin
MDIQLPHLAAAPPPPPTRPERAASLDVFWARHGDDVRQAQRLRYQVFVDEMGARLSPPQGTPPGLDVDLLDARCEHLIVRTRESAHAPAQVVGTYRVLLPAAARLAGGLYGENEFDLSALQPMRKDMAELGRSCTAPQWRQGGVILLLWTHLAAFLKRNRLAHVFGCASVPMRDGGHYAASLWHGLRQTHLAEPARRVTPKLPLPVDELDGHLKVEPPALIKGYLRCGARVLGPPAWDPDFGVADLPLLLDIAALPAAYQRRFLGG